MDTGRRRSEDLKIQQLSNYDGQLRPDTTGTKNRTLCLQIGNSEETKKGKGKRVPGGEEVDGRPGIG